MSEAVLLSRSPYGYGAKTLEQTLKYLVRTVSGVCFATEEEQQAAHWLKVMQDKICLLEHELKLLHEKNNLSNHRDEMDEDLDGQRIKYCLVNGVILSGGCLHSGLEEESIVNDDFRSAIDRLMAY